MILGASAEWGTLLVDGEEPGDWLRASRMRGTTIYADETVSAVMLASLVSYDDDYAFGSPGEVYGVSLRTAGKGRVTLYRGDAWGFSGVRADAIVESIREIQAILAERGLDWRPTAAGTASAILRGLGLLEQGPMRPQWRSMAHEAIHLGPILHCAGGSDDCIYVDRRGAFLAALDADMPSGGWSLARTPSVSAALASEATLVVATVDVEPTARNCDCPPLSIRRDGASVQPWGTFSGCWTGGVLKDAVERGDARIVRVIAVARAGHYSPFLRPAFDLLASLPKVAAKPLYTRVWGKMAGTGGGWTGRTTPQGDTDEPQGELWWHHSAGRSPWDTRVSDAYRPDLAAFIVSNNFRFMRDAISKLRPESLISAYIDSIFTEDESVLQSASHAPDFGGFRLEGRGRLRAYNHGIYEFSDATTGESKLAAMGWQSDAEPGSDSLRAYATSANMPLVGRAWNGDPRTDEDAASSPLLLGDESGGYTPSGWAAWDPTFWTSAGFVKPRLIPGNTEPMDGDGMDGVL